MPELPDVKLFRRCLDRTCRGRVIERVAVHDLKMLSGIPSGAFAARVKGARILTAQCHGKNLLVELAPAG